MAEEGLHVPSLGDEHSETLRAEMLDAVLAMQSVDRLEAFRETGTLSAVFFDHLAAFYDAYDRYVAHNILASKLAIVCRASCSRCCCQPVMSVEFFEIINIYRSLRRDAAAYGRIHDDAYTRAKEFHDELRAQDPERSEGAFPAEVVQRTQRALAVRAAPCPLLQQDGRCGAYAQRPISCRMYYSLTDPALCTSEKGRNFALKPPLEVEEALAAVSARLGRGSGLLSHDLMDFGDGRQLAPWRDAPPPEPERDSD
jgi:Fe-S-cluster containining protein